MYKPDEDSDDQIQRLLNDAKRADLEERYGMHFVRAANSTLPPEVEGEWLDHIAEFERLLESADEIPLRQFVGYPEARALADLPASEVETELTRLLETLYQHDIVIDFPDEVEAAEAYRFIVEELLDEEIADIRMPGTRKHFVYEEFRP
jgi:hypothetical protein